MKLEILYEDAHLLVCYKPAGVPVQSAGVGRQDCVSILKNYLYEQQKLKEGSVRHEPYVGVVHRLDQPVEGVLVFAKTSQAAAFLSAQAAEGAMQKHYLAMCTPVFADACPPWKESQNHIKVVDNVDRLVDKSGIFVDFLLKNGKNNLSCVVSADTPGAKMAKLEYEVLAEKDGKRIVKIKLLTGRHHQIRVQMAHHGNPLVGDSKYGLKNVEKKNVDKFSNEKINVALCAYQLEFIHPKTKKEMRFEICPRHPYLAEAYHEICC